jgi:hypothetical protein
VTRIPSALQNSTGDVLLRAVRPLSRTKPFETRPGVVSNSPADHGASEL